MHPHQSFTLSRSFFDLFLWVFLFSRPRRIPNPPSRFLFSSTAKREIGKAPPTQPQICCFQVNLLNSSGDPFSSIFPLHSFSPESDWYSCQLHLFSFLKKISGCFQDFLFSSKGNASSCRSSRYIFLFSASLKFWFDDNFGVKGTRLIAYMLADGHRRGPRFGL